MKTLRFQHHDVRFNMAPLIDVVFLLIIFFLVSSHLAQQEVQLELDLPTAASGQSPGEDQTRRVVVNVLPDGRSGQQIMEFRPRTSFSIHWP